MAVYTHVSNDDAARFLSAYAIGALRELTGIKSGVSNSNYFLYTDKGRYVLTLYEKYVKEGDLPFFLGLLDHLAKKGLPVPVPVRAKDGALFGKLAGKAAAITAFLNGAMTSRVTPSECGEVGRMLAMLHVAAADFPLTRASSRGFGNWDKLHRETKPRAHEVKADLGEIMQQELDFLRLRWPSDLPSGIIHGDYFPDNVFFADQKLCGVIDFNSACNDILAYDLAIALNAWCFEASGAFNITKAQSLMRGYESARPLAAQEKKLLPLLARGASMRFLTARLYDWLNVPPDALVKPLDPLAYLTRLQFHQMVTDVRAYGLSV